MSLENKQRLAWVDTAKGLGILVVIIGHMADHTLLPHALTFKWFVMIFSMPLFFILSGYMFKPRTTREVIVARGRSLIIPYVVYLALIFGFLHIRALMTGAESLTDVVHSAVRAAYGGQLLVAHLGVFWFVTCLFFTQLGYHFLARYFKKPHLLALVVGGLGLFSLLIANAMPWLKLPLAVNIVPIAIMFYALGHFLSSQTYSQRDLGMFVGFVIIICVLAGFTGVPFALDMKLLTFTPLLLIVPFAFSICWVVFELCKIVCERPNTISTVLSELGNASLVIMFLHQFIHFEMREAGVNNDMLILALCLGLPYAIYKLATRYTLSQKFLLGTGWR